KSETPSLLISLTVIAAIAVILLIGTITFEAPIELAMLFALVFLITIIYLRGYSFVEAQESTFNAIRSVLELVFILFSVGMLISTWAQAGTIPTIIRFGLEAISPSWFYVSAILLCSITSLFTGTSWGTMGSVGVA